MRLIDALPLYDRACELEGQALQHLKSMSGTDFKVWSAILAERTAFKHDIMDAPTIDAVPVVRCADCKYLNEDLAIGEWDGSCRYWNTHSTLYSWFCSQGKRKDGADNG